MFMTILNSVFAEPSVAPVVNWYNGFVSGIGDFYPYVVIALCLFVGFFGRRLSDLIRVVLMFAIGFVASVYWVAPLVQEFVPTIPAIAVGIAVGLFIAVMSRMIYNFVYIGCIGFDVYNICFNALFLVELTSKTQGNLILSVGIAFLAVVIALVLRKYLEMIITAGAAGIGLAFYLDKLFGYAQHLNLDANTGLFIVGALIAVPMFIYQYYNRVIY